MVKSSSVLRITTTEIRVTRLPHWLSIGIVVLWIVPILVTRCIAQEKKVTFDVIMPASSPKDSKIYVAGNHPLLGDWNPGKAALQKSNDSVWTAQFAFPVGFNLEFKITRGSWNTEAIYDDGIIPGNSSLTVRSDTEVVIRPKSWRDVSFKSAGGIVGTVKYQTGLQGDGLKYPRDLIVWLPPSYGKEPTRRFPVLYMHDGQNIIDPSTSFIGYDWRIDEMADSLIRTGAMQEIIVVGINNSPDRMPEYSDTDLGRSYARFVVHTVKPLIDSLYRTIPDRSHTAVMGSSMGGLMSFLLVWWYPDVFSKAGCLSSVFSFDHEKFLHEVEAENGRSRDFRIYMDCGGFGEEATLRPGMDKMVALLQEKGYAEHKDFEWFYDPLAEHSERAWAARLWRPLLFLFGTH